MQRIPSLDGLRAISILMVVVGHWAGAYWGSALPLSYAFAGVRIFFVISGYLITRLLLEERDRSQTISLSEFYVRRAYRILPAATVFLVTMLMVHRQELTWYHAAMAAFYLADFDPTKPRFFRHLWSLSVEEQFYLVWPSVLKRWYAHRVKILVGVMAIAPFCQLALYAVHYPGPVVTTFLGVADNLAIGCLVAILQSRLFRIPGWLGLLMAAMVILITPLEGVTKRRTLIFLFSLTPILYTSIAGVLLHVVQTPYRLLNWSPVVWVGRISYSLYLWQEIFVFDRQRPAWYFMFIATGVAALSFYLVEQPMLRLREKRAKRNKSLQLFDRSTRTERVMAAPVGGRIAKVG